ncbi:hypothetical protein Tco_0018753 [Tanacetum coccineum]
MEGTNTFHVPNTRLVTEKYTSDKEFDESDHEPTNKPTGRRRPRGVTIKQLVDGTMQALKANRKISKTHSHNGGSSEGTGITPGVPDESTIIFTTSSEGTSTVPGVLDKAKGTSESKADSAIDWGSKNKSDYSTESDEIKGIEKEKIDKEEIEWVSTNEEEDQQDDDRSIDIEKTNDDEETDDEYV